MMSDIQITVDTARLRFVLLLSLWLVPQRGGGAQTQEDSNALRTLVRSVCSNEIGILQRKDSRLRYQIRRMDRKGITTRDQIESHDGSVARLVLHNDESLTSAEDDGERARLKEMLGTSKLQMRERDETKNRSYGVELLQALPSAMILRKAQPQKSLPDVSDEQLVVDFAPDPQFRPEDLPQQILTKLTGRMWIDLADRQVLRAEMRNLGDVNLAWGLLVKVPAGGTLLYEQRKFSGIYAFTRIEMHVQVRELIVKTSMIDTETTVSAVRHMDSSPSGDAAIHMLLDEKVPTR